MKFSQLEREALAHMQDWSRPLAADVEYDSPYGVYAFSLSREELHRLAPCDLSIWTRSAASATFGHLEFSVDRAA